MNSFLLTDLLSGGRFGSLSLCEYPTGRRGWGLGGRSGGDPAGSDTVLWCETGVLAGGGLNWTGGSSAGG